MTGLPPPPRGLSGPERAAFTYRESFQPVRDMIAGSVAELTRDGFTDDQARAIVARMWGWRPPDDDEDDPTDPGGEENRRV